MAPTDTDAAAAARTQRDRCPGVVRPWRADDGALVRIRLVGGAIDASALTGLGEVAATYGDGDLHLTARANLQLRGVEHCEQFVDAVEALGLLPSRAHDQARNIMVSPLTGRLGGRLDAQAIAVELDHRLRADPTAAALPGRFLFVLDDGRGDLTERTTDLGLTALDDGIVQLRVGDRWGPVVAADEVAAVLAGLAKRFLDVRGTDAGAAWHVSELTPSARTALDVEDVAADPRTDTRAAAPGAELGDALLTVPDGLLAPDLVARVTATGGPLVVTPWRSIIRTDLIP